VDRRFLSSVVVPVGVATAFMLVLHHFLDWDGFFLSMAANLVTLVFTVMYVDRALRSHMESRQYPANARVNTRVWTFANACMSCCRDALGYDVDILDHTSFENLEPLSIANELKRASKDIIEPMAVSRVQVFRQQDWHRTKARADEIWGNTNHIMTVFGSRIEPTVWSNLLDIQESVRSISDLIFTWESILDVPTRKPDIRDFVVKRVAADISRVSSLARELSELTLDNSAIRPG